jgi:8-oxo-dGTP pyrophosphatase MutT (NUDIX family)
VKRTPRDVSVHLFRLAPAGWQFLMLRRPPALGGFWQAVSGAPFRGETDEDAAVREVREETGFDVRGGLFGLDVTYAYALRPELAERWQRLYGSGVARITVVAFAAEAPNEGDPRLDPLEHDAFAWCSYEKADALLDWPIEQDALAGRREALRALVGRLGTENWMIDR